VLDAILEGGTVVDGTGTPGFVTDVAISGDTIVRIADCSDLDARERVDCTGLVVAPGFIDMHGHSDELLLVEPSAESKITQGVTTEVGGNCGTSPGPLSEDAFAIRRARLRSMYGFDFEWRDIGGFLDRLDAEPPALNFACLVGLGETRASVGGDRPLPLEAAALARECAAVRTACEQGAIGVSSGLIYPPGNFADTTELVALASAARAAGSPLYATHLRDEGDRLIEAVDEAIEIGRRADVGVQLSHHKAAGKRNWGKVHDSLARIDRARALGLDVSLDQYPYKASSTGLDVILPEDVNVGGGDAVARRLSDPAYAKLVAARVELEYAGRWRGILVSAVAGEANRGYEGLTIEQIAARSGAAPVDAALALLRDERLDVQAIYFTMCEDDLRTVLSYGLTCIGSDASARSPSGLTGHGKPHPRAYGTFPRVLARYVRAARLLTLEEAVRRCTSLASTRIGLRKRGAIALGWHADVTVFDSKTISDTATYEDPHRISVGVARVYVNGVTVAVEGRQTGARPGRVLRRGRDL
jgi:N-acyl-D-amino-acid deacylase